MVGSSLCSGQRGGVTDNSDKRGLMNVSQRTSYLSSHNYTTHYQGHLTPLATISPSLGNVIYIYLYHDS